MACDATWRLSPTGVSVTCDRIDRHRKHLHTEPGLLIEWTDDAEGVQREDDHD